MSNLEIALVGADIGDGWTIESAWPNKPGTGGQFSEGFIAKNRNGDTAFLKALDLSRSEQARDKLRDAELRIQVFNYERSLLELCADRHLSNVVKAIKYGIIPMDGVPFNEVHYLLFEAASGDLRGQAQVNLKFDVAFALRALHQTTKGLQQLHGVNVAHQDVKPSNVLVFEGALAKIADLGHAVARSAPRPGRNGPVAGDPTYAPPEALYNETPSDWATRRLSCDLYHLGSIAVFLFLGRGATDLIVEQLEPQQRPDRWADGYMNILPVIRTATDSVLSEFQESLPESMEHPDKLVRIVRELCEPDPTLRGHPLNRAGRGARYGVERYLSEFANMAARAELSLKREMARGRDS